MTLPAIPVLPTAVNPGAAEQSSCGTRLLLAPTPLTDLRWLLIEKYFRSRELRPNARKSYEREFRSFLKWTDKGWKDITARDINRYKEYLKVLPSVRKAKRATATINLSLSALQSLFKWLYTCDYVAKNPMILIEKPKPDPVEFQEWSSGEV